MYPFLNYFSIFLSNLPIPLKPFVKEIKVKDRGEEHELAEEEDINFTYGLANKFEGERS